MSSANCAVNFAINARNSAIFFSSSTDVGVEVDVGTTTSDVVVAVCETSSGGTVKPSARIRSSAALALATEALRRRRPASIEACVRVKNILKRYHANTVALLTRPWGGLQLKEPQSRGCNVRTCHAHDAAALCERALCLRHRHGFSPSDRP